MDMQLGLYEGTQYGGICKRVTFIVKYDMLVDLLKTCPHTVDYHKLLGVIKAIKKSEKLEAQLSSELYGYGEAERDTSFDPGTNGWRNGEIGFLAYDGKGKCEVITLWISYELAADLIVNAPSKYIEELDEMLKNTPMSDNLKKVFLDRGWGE